MSDGFRMTLDPWRNDASDFISRHNEYFFLKIDNTKN